MTTQDTRADEADESVTLHALARNAGAAVDRVRLQRRHIRVTRRNAPAAMLVPVDWWENAVKATGREPAL